MKLGVRRLVLLLVGAQLSALCIYIALRDVLEHADEQYPPPRRARDSRVTVAWQGRA